MKTVAISDSRAGVTILIRTSLESPQCQVLSGISDPGDLGLTNPSSSGPTVTDWMVQGLKGVTLITVVQRPTAQEAAPCSAPVHSHRLRALSAVNG
jgi:hypothetical protein